MISGLRWCIGIPVVGTVVGEAYHSHLNMMCVTGRQVTIVVPAVRDVFPHGEARNEIWKMAVQHNCTHMAFLDSDMVVEDASMFLKLYDIMRKTRAVMTVGHCMRRGMPYTPTWFKRDETGKTWVVGADKSSRPFTLDSCGLACNLIDMAWIQKNVPEGTELFFQGIHEGTKYAEDAWFCNKILENGGKIVGVPEIRVGHVGERMVVNDMTAPMLLDLYQKINPTKTKEASEGTYTEVPMTEKLL